MRYLFATLLILTLSVFPNLATAQEDDGEGFLTRLIQDKLSDAGRAVDIEGFRGALSSEATLQRMTISDEDGIWLELNGATLRWNRSALLRGRLEVQELSADSLTINRLPASDDANAEASGFAIPDLPVAVNVDNVSIGALNLGEPVLGEPAQFTFQGNALLDGNRLATQLRLERVDRDGLITAVIDVQPDANQLVVEITAEEPENGIAARLLDLPGRPSVSLQVDGDGPLDDFTANIALASDGQDRLAGTVTLTGQSDGGQAFAADLGGDLTAVLLPQAREFLGDDIRLTAQGVSGANGGLVLDQFALSAAAVSLDGSFASNAEGRPQRFALNGEIIAPDGTPVTLPFGEGLTLRQGTIAAQFDASESDEVVANITLADFAQPDLTIGIGELAVRGTLATSGAPAVDLKLDAALSQMAFADPAMQAAVGTEITATTNVTWQEGDDIVLDRLDVQGADYSAQVDATLTGGGRTSIVTADGRVGFQDLSRLAALTGTDLAGRAALGFSLSADVLGGSFAVTAEGSTTDLALGIAQLDPVLGGDAELELAANRGPDGIGLDTFVLRNDQVSLTASGLLGDSSGRIEYDLALVNSGAFTGAEGGPLAVSGAVQRLPDAFEVSAFGGGTDPATGIEQVDALLRGETDLAVRLTLGDQIILEEARISTPALSVEGQGNLTTGARDVTLTGQLYDSGVVTGNSGGPFDLTVRALQAGDATDVTITGTGRDLATGIAQADALLRGQTDLDISLSLGDRLLLTSAEITNPALSLQAEGDLTEGQRDIRASVTLQNSGAVLGANGGPITANLRAEQQGDAYDLTVDGTGTNIGTGQALVDGILRGQTTFSAAGRVADGELRLDRARVDNASLTASASGTVANGATNVDFSARLASLAQVVPQAPAGPLSASGSIAQAANGGLRLNIQADGPGGTVARVSGQVGLPGGAVDLDISGNAPMALANPYIAPRSITGQASFDLSMTGQPGLSALSGQVTVGNARASVPSAGIAVEAINGAVSLSGGRAQVDLRASVNGGAISVSGPVTLSGNYPANLTATLNNIPLERPGLFTTRANGQVTVSGGLTGGGVIGGRIGLTETELRIPAGGFGGVEPIPDMRHVNEGAASRNTRARAGLIGNDSGGASGGGGSLGLNLRIVADSSIFLRGRGIDAELRGALTLEGTTADVRPVGQFELVRGRIDILTKRLDLTEGTLRLAGGFDPIIRLVAESQAGEYVVQIVLNGAAGSPEVVFTSRPELPEDEVLSQLFFERGISSLSPLQAARLALAIAELTGRSSGGVVGKIRDGAGLDDLDVSQTEDGATALSAGKYVSENVYTEVEATSEGKTSLSINLDVTKNLTAKGKVGSGGDSSIGLFFEKDY